MAQALEVAQLYATMRLKGQNEVAGGLNGIKNTLSALQSTFLTFAGPKGLGALVSIGKELAATGAKFESYRKRLQAVSSSADEAGEIFARMSKWAAVNPVDTDDAIAAFVRLKTAAVANTEEATKQLGNLAAVMGTTIQENAEALVSLNGRYLRRLGIQLDQTGKKARVQIGETVVYAKKNSAAIQEAIVSAIDKAYAGQMEKMKDTWQGNINTMGGMWVEFKRQVAGDAGSGGPFDQMKNILSEIRREWEQFTASPEYPKFVNKVQRGIKSVLATALEAFATVSGELSSLVATVEKYSSTLEYGLLGKIFFGVKGMAIGASLGIIKDIAVSAQERARMDPAKRAKLEALESDLKTKEAAYTQAHGGTEAGVHEVRSLLSKDAQKALDEKKLAEQALEEYKRELRKGTPAGYTESFFAESEKILKERAVKLRAQLRYSDRVFSEGIDADNTEGYLPGADGKNSTTAAPTPEEILQGAKDRVQRIRDEVKYSSKTFEDFGVEISSALGRFPEYSEEWKLYKDLQIDGRNELIKKVEEAAQRITRTEDWQYQQGEMSADAYFDELAARYQDTMLSMEGLEAGAKRDSFVEKARSSIESMQNVALEAANKIREKFEEGKMSQDEAITGVNALMARFSALGKKAPEELKKLAEEMAPLKEAIKSWTSELKNGITDAIVECKSLGDALKNVGQQIEKAALNMILWGSMTGMGGKGGLLSGLFKGLHTGGIVGTESSFTRRLTIPKFHSGGIVGAGEELAILKRNEGVFTKGQMAALGASMGPQSIAVHVNVENNGGGDMTDEQAQLLGKTVRTAVQAQVAEELYKYQRQGYFRQRAGAF